MKLWLKIWRYLGLENRANIMIKRYLNDNCMLNELKRQNNTFQGSHYITQIADKYLRVT